MLRLKYIKILFGRRWVIQQILCDIIISYASNVFLWLHIRSAINMEFSVWIYGYQTVNVCRMYVMMDLKLAVVSVLVWRVLSQNGYRVMWRVISLFWPSSILGWVHWLSANRSISFVVGGLYIILNLHNQVLFFVKATQIGKAWSQNRLL